MKAKQPYKSCPSSLHETSVRLYYDLPKSTDTTIIKLQNLVNLEKRSPDSLTSQQIR